MTEPGMAGMRGNSPESEGNGNMPIIGRWGMKGVGNEGIGAFIWGANPGSDARSAPTMDAIQRACSMQAAS